MKAPRIGSAKWVACQSLETVEGMPQVAANTVAFFCCRFARLQRGTGQTVEIFMSRVCINNRQTHLKALLSCEGGGRGGAEGR